MGPRLCEQKPSSGQRLNCLIPLSTARSGRPLWPALTGGRRWTSLRTRSHGVAIVGLSLSIAQREASLGVEGALIGALIEAFLRDVEARAYRIALVQIRDRHEALDIVQDAMIRLVRRYASRPSEEWPALFFRILQNRIRDCSRQRGVCARGFGLFWGSVCGYI